jgi:hypothetical protein
MIGIVWFILVSVVGITIWRFYVSDKKGKQKNKK